MKKEPNEVDREAARLFRAEVRMRAFTEFARGTVINADPMGDGTICVTLVGEGTYEAMGRTAALDTDDGPTKGAMLDQIRADRDDPHVSVQWIDGQWCVCAGPVGQFSEFLGTGPTEGAALVDAKKAKDQP